MQPGTSSMIQGLAACCTGLEDPRETGRCDHQLIDILVIAVCAVIACAKSWEDIALYGRSKQAWLETFLALPNGIPSQGSRMSLVCDDLEHVAVVPSSPLAPATEACLGAPAPGDQVESDLTKECEVARSRPVAHAAVILAE